MCVLLIGHRVHPIYDLVVGANRDEFHQRPSAPAAFWEDHPELLAGRDLEAGGTWLGVNRAGRFSAVTNLRGAAAASPGHSRGHLVRDFLRKDAPALPEFLSALGATARLYAGCNLLIADGDDLHWWSPAGDRRLAPGIHGVSNTSHEEEWPKVGRLKQAFQPLMGKEGQALIRAMLALLRDIPEPGSSPLFRAGGVEEQIFVDAGAYGTRCSSVVLRDRSRGRLIFVERRYDSEARAVGDFEEVLALN